jgi:hypothetical protein
MFARRATAVAYLIGLLTVTQGLGAEPPQEAKVTVHGQRERGTAIWRVSPPPTPPHNVADLSEFVMANSCAATLRGGGHLTPRERLQEKTAGDSNEVIQLFDGKTLNGWTNVNGAPVKEGWTVEDGALVRTGRGGAIYAKGEYHDFALDFDWAIAAGGNSGVKYRVRFYKKGVWGNPGWLGCEYQIYDNSKRPGAFYSKTSAGALYAIYSPNKKKHLKPVGQYNHSRIVSHGTRVEHWLNGEKIVAVDTASQDWKEHVAQSKFAPVKDFAQNRRGRIQFQDHGSKVWFRNITIRPLRPTDAAAPHDGA